MYMYMLVRGSSSIAPRAIDVRNIELLIHIYSGAGEVMSLRNVDFFSLRGVDAAGGSARTLLCGASD